MLACHSIAVNLLFVAHIASYRIELRERDPKSCCASLVARLRKLRGMRSNYDCLMRTQKVKKTKAMN
ncbi:unnamed protein product [Echinostoma caproni]|uniref:Secreted protein n=1 Tax=Echinostoma caproni TaxID=27848 RepID=A0A183A408_9TREM|nr:unnamed protein product [Echinostoma caproni]